MTTTTGSGVLDEASVWRPSGYPACDRDVVEALVGQHLQGISADLAARAIDADVAAERVAALAAFRAEAGAA